MRCGKYGHKAADCPLRGQSSGASGQSGDGGKVHFCLTNEENDEEYFDAEEGADGTSREVELAGLGSLTESGGTAAGAPFLEAANEELQVVDPAAEIFVIGDNTFFENFDLI